MGQDVKRIMLLLGQIMQQTGELVSLTIFPDGSGNIHYWDGVKRAYVVLADFGPFDQTGVEGKYPDYLAALRAVVEQTR